MHFVRHKTAIPAAGCLLLLLLGCGRPEPHAAFSGIASPTGLVARTGEFRRDIVTVVPGVHVAIGYGLANAVLLEGDDGCVLVDTLESMEAAEALKADLAGITTKPLVAMIYTHGHGDHIFGAAAFDTGRGLPIYAQAGVAAAVSQSAGMLRPLVSRRSLRMFGTYLDRDARINAGVGAGLALDADSRIGALQPTHTFDDRLSVTLAGIQLELVHAPGESGDQLFVWLPAARVLLCGDTYYKAFPNLYSVRGGPPRDILGWIRTLDTMRALQPLHLIPGHTRPVSGEEEIARLLGHYRDAIQYVHDQTVRGMNRGLTPDELVEVVKLPTHLAKRPELGEYYGTVAWSVRAVYHGYMGWFDGNVAHLNPLAPRERAEETARLAGGADALLERAEAAMGDGRAQWALELSDHLRLLPVDATRVQALRVAALTALGERDPNAPGRNFYLTRAAEVAGHLVLPDLVGATPEMLDALPVRVFFSALSVSLDPRKAAEIDQVVAFHFPDTGETYSMHVRRGVAEVREGADGAAELTVHVASRAFKELLLGRQTPSVVLARDMRVDGSKVALTYFLDLFDPAPPRDTRTP